MVELWCAAVPAYRVTTTPTRHLPVLKGKCVKHALEECSYSPTPTITLLRRSFLKDIMNEFFGHSGNIMNLIVAP